jgi:hypothetical protein
MNHGIPPAGSTLGGTAAEPVDETAGFGAPIATCKTLEQGRNFGV